VRRRLAAAAVLALLVAVGAWFAVSAPSDDATIPPPPTKVPVATTARATSVESPKAPEPSRVRRRSDATDAPRAAPVPTVTLFSGRAVFEDGRPAVGARVRAFMAAVKSRDDAGRIGSECRVGDDGRFEIVGPEQETGQCVVYGVLPGFAYVGLVTEDKDVTLTFVRGGTVSGTVYAADGKPCPNVEVRLVRCDPAGRVATSRVRSVWSRPEIAAFYTQSTWTDAGGRYRIVGAPLVVPGDRRSVAVVKDADGDEWRSDVAQFETSGGELVRDVRVGANAFDERDPFRRIEGRVTDAEGRVVEDASVVYGVLVGGAEAERKTDETDNAGRFVIDLGAGFECAGRPVEVRVAAPGYWNWRGAPTKPGEILRVTLTHWDREPAPSRVLGTAVDSNDRPIVGAVVVDLVDEFFRASRQWATTDERGEFALEGLWQGTWRLSLDGGESVEVGVRDGDVARVRLRATHDASAVLAKTSGESAKALTLVDASRFVELTERRAKLVKDGLPTKDVDDELRRAIDDAKWTEITLPRREVLVVGVPTDGSYVVQASLRGRAWRVVAKDGVARFASLSTETWKFSVERFGVPTAPRDVEIEQGDGPQRIEVGFPK
jgi:hypothetical protein